LESILQYELKKCYRWESPQHILDRHKDYTFLTKTRAKTIEVIDKLQNKLILKKKALENQLSTFYHWRLKLSFILIKFGIKIEDMPKQNNGNNFELYHGVNSKMILDIHATLACFGPLSTSISFYVSKTFATEKGMVLSLKSNYPTSGLDRVFNASILSDFPDEQEWLIGFMYARIVKVSTDFFVKTEILPIVSQYRALFFVLHLFSQQIFSLSEDLEELMIALIECLLCCEKIKGHENEKELPKKAKKIYKYIIDKNFIKNKTIFGAQKQLNMKKEIINLLN